jgi:hypothetical protein
MDESQETSRSQLLSLLDSEIERIQTQDREPGWTKWALLGGLGTDLWLISNELEHGSIDWQKSAIFFLWLFLAKEFLAHLNGLLAFRSNNKSGPRFFLFKAYGQQLRRLAIFYAFMYALPLFLLIHVAFPLSTHSIWFLRIYLIFFAFVSCLAIPLSFLRLPFSVGPERRSVRVTLLILFLLITVPLSELSSYIINTWSTFTQPTLRVSTLFLIGLYLIQLLLRGQTGTPLLNTLIELRRSLVLGQIDYQSAFKQAEVAFSGLRVSDVLQDEVNIMLSHMNEINIRLESMRKELQALESHESDPALASTIQRSLSSLLDEIEKSLEILESGTQRLGKRIRWIFMIAPNSEGELKSIQSKLLESIRSIRENIQSVAQHLENLKGKHEETTQKLSEAK